VGFHGHYNRDGHVEANLIRQQGLKDWILKYSDGKADPALVERWINIEVNRGMMHLYHPVLLRNRGGMTFFCQGNEPTRCVFACPIEPRTALGLDAITSLDVIAANDQDTLRSALAQSRSKPSGFAAIDDISRVPLSTEAGIGEYRRDLAADTTKAFAISPDRKHWELGILRCGATRSLALRGVRGATPPALRGRRGCGLATA
jgi:hypothetical protein